MNGQLTLLELNNLIRDALQDAFPETIWVVAEISELKINRTGHCYLELIEKDSVSDDIVARARATIWSYTFRMLKPYFETATGQPFSDGIKVLVLVSVEYHPAYGLSFNIKDIDPTYTVGDLVRRRREIIEKLQEAGVFDMNRELPLPLVPQRIAIISSATAAGYQDFVNQLEHNSYGFIFHHRLFEAFMQGAEAAPSILRALDRIYAEEENFDAVAIIRGGGAQADLSCFDNFELAYTVAQFPLPVVTGIGHEKDDTIIDLVAHTRQKTPTAVAEFFISGAARFYEKLTELQKAVAERTREILESHAETLTNLADDIVHSAGKYLTDSQFRLLRLGQRYKNSVNRYVAQHAENLHRFHSRTSKFATLLLRKERNYLARLGRETRFLGKSQLDHNALKVQQLEKQLPQKVRSRLLIAGKELAAREAALRLLDPQNVLRRGFTLALQNGKIIKSSHEISETNDLETRFHDGSVFSKIIKK